MKADHGIASDYPAAHSMDTCWFAVDADGEIAEMDTGQEGPVPVGHHEDHHYGDLLSGTADGDGVRWLTFPGELAARGASVQALDALRSGLLGEQVENGLFVLSDDAALPAVLGKKTAKWTAESRVRHDVLRFAGPRAIYFIENAQVSTLRRACDRGLVEAAWLLPPGDRGESFRELLGLHGFRAEWFHRYGRRNRPTRPIRVGDLPPALAAKVGGVSLAPLHFAQGDAVYPPGFIHCDRWSEGLCEYPLWFAVDAAGQAAAFRARGAGHRVPWTHGAPLSTLQDLVQAFPRGGDGVARLPRPAADAAAWLSAREAAGDDLTDAPESLASLFEPGSDVAIKTLLPAPEGDVLRLDGTPPMFLVHRFAWDDEGGVKLRASGRLRDLDEDEALVDVLGLALYECEGGGGGPYLRRRVPARWTLAASWPPMAREILSTAVFSSLRFDEAEEIDLGQAVFHPIRRPDEPKSAA